MTVQASEETAIEERVYEPARPPSTLGRWGLAAFVALAYVPVLLTDVGKIDADSKAYLYLDPGRLLAGSASLWDPKIGLGTIAYQMVGFLFPVGPFFWVTEHLIGLSPWIAQRFWIGTLILFAGLGTRYLLRTLGLRGPGIAVGMVAYALTPYALQFTSTTSVLLPPWAGMPWMTAFVVLGLRRGGWKYPALLALTVQLTGAVNASTLTFALLAPALWIPYAVVLAREVDWRRAWGLVWRSTLLVVLTSLWWAEALAIESAFGRNVLRYTEQPVTTAATMSPIEALRGLGYWIFYYREGNGPVGGAAATFMRNPTVLFVSILIPALALLAAAGVRWGYRAYFVLLVLVGVTLGVGSAPLGDSSPFGSVFESFAKSSTAGFALRNSARAVPLIALGLACLLAAGATAAHRWLAERGRTRVALLVVAVVIVLCLVDAPGVWGRSYYDPTLEWKSVPTYWKQAARSLDAQSHSTRVLALPGSPFAAYNWGTTQDPVEPALMTRPFGTIEQIPWGSDATANLLAAVDVPLQAGTFDPNALAAVARLMGVGDVLLDLDLQTGRYGLVPADALWNLFSARPPAGFATPEIFGTAPNRTSRDPGNVARPPLPASPPLAVLPVHDPLPIVRTKSEADPLVVDGDGNGVVSLATAGLLDARRLLLYSPTFARDPAVLRDLAPGASLVVTDSNRKRPYWSTSLTKSYGPTEQADEQPLAKSPYDQRLDVFPDAGTDAQTVTIMRGVKSVRATQGYHVFNLVATRPSLVLDGSIYTGWSIDAGAKTVGKERLRIDFLKPVTTDEINISQPVDDGSQGRWITRVTLRFDGHRSVHATLDEASRTAVGQTLHFPKRRFSSVEIQIDAVHHTPGTPYNGVGFQEIRLANDAPYAKPFGMQELARMPVDLLKTLGSASLAHPLTFLMSRDAMDDSAMTRQIWLPTKRTFSLTGTVTPGARASDTELDRLLGIPDATAGGVTARAGEHYSDIIARASSAIDGDPGTAWTTPLDKGKGSIEVTTPGEISFDHLDLQLVDDGRHSLPTELTIAARNGPAQTVDLTSVPHTPGPDGTVSVPVRLKPLRGNDFTFSITRFRPATIATLDHPEGAILPSAIAELGIPGVRRAPTPVNLPSACNDDLVKVDGVPFPVRVSGTTAAALQEQSLRLSSCDGKPLTLSAGVHEIQSAESPESRSGADVDNLVLASGPGGDPVAPAQATDGGAASGPAIRIVKQTRTSMRLEADASSKPYWLVLGQSLNRGWHAKVDGHDLGEPTLVDGYANGWLLPASTSGKVTTISLEWTPQRRLRLAFLVSLLAALACVAIVITALARRRGRVAYANAPPPVLRNLLRSRPLDTSRRVAVVATVTTATLLAGVLVQPWVGPIVGVLVCLAIRYPRWRALLRLVPATLVVGVAIYVTVAQITHNYPAVFPWPTYFDGGRIPVWVAVVLVACDALISVVWRTELDSPRSSETG